MEDVVNLFDNNVEIKSPTKKERMQKYKESYKTFLSSSKFLNQEQRRKDLLERQKRAREESRNQNRRNLSEEAFSKNPFAPKAVTKYKNILMESEWFLQVPLDLKENWYCTLCPKGQRTLVVASRGITQSFRKDGRPTAIFKSALPGGSNQTTQDRFQCTMLDCIWDLKKQVLYVLDILAWRNHEFIGCETEFRFYWIKSQMFDALPELTQVGPYNDYPFVDIQRCKCDKDSMINLFASPNENLDGILFYHREAHYTAGETPLVGWLFPWMIPEILELEAPNNSDPKPPGSEDTLKFVKTWASRRKNKKIKFPEKIPKFDQKKSSSENLNEEGNINEEEEMNIEESPSTSSNSSPASTQQIF